MARYEGRVVFVRHALPGERVLAAVTDGSPGSAYWRADAVQVLVASPDRVVPPCPYAHPGGCGGCDWQHAALPAQRRLKAAVVAEQLRRLAGLAVPVVVEPVPGDREGLGWRTRLTYAVDDAGRAGLHPHRSHQVLPVAACAIAHPALDGLGVARLAWPGVTSVQAVVAGSGERAVVVAAAAAVRIPDLPPDVAVVPEPGAAQGQPVRARGRSYVRESAGGRTWRVHAAGFWQVHPGAADALVATVRAATGPAVGETVLDLYSGVGLLAGCLAVDVGPRGLVVAVESDARAVRDARRNLHDLPHVRLVHARVDRALAGAGVPPGADIVVLDPPRRGAGAAVCRRVALRRPRVVAYVACDPAALARDVAHLAAAGYALAGLRAFDLFPMTHHVECVATLVPAR